MGNQGADPSGRQRYLEPPPGIVSLPWSRRALPHIMETQPHNQPAVREFCRKESEAQRHDITGLWPHSTREAELAPTLGHPAPGPRFTKQQYEGSI